MLVCESGGACAVPAGHGGVHNAPHHVHRVVNLYAAPISKGEPSVALGRGLDGVGSKGHVWLGDAVEGVLVPCTTVRLSRPAELRAMTDVLFKAISRIHGGCCGMLPTSGAAASLAYHV